MVFSGFQGLENWNIPVNGLVQPETNKELFFKCFKTTYHLTASCFHCSVPLAQTN